MIKKSYNSSSDTRNQLYRSGLKARKSLGQHFLTDQTVLYTIIESAELSPDDTVIEVGPGLGIVTEELAKHAGHVIAVELDTNLANRLRRKLASYHNITIINADILKKEIVELLGDHQNYKVVANIPYYITSPILHYFISAIIRPSLMVVMVQKEVGEAIAAIPGKLSVLAISMQLLTRPEIVAVVPAARFYPVPKVDSVVIRFNFLSQPKVAIDDIDTFLDFVGSGFSAPRKLIANSLSMGLGIRPADAAAILLKSGIDLQKRPEALTIMEWEKLYKISR
jgi:16S rRNA (adenine1518-N6/adenine1519-N6)-dimethyltransferase